MKAESDFTGMIGLLWVLVPTLQEASKVLHTVPKIGLALWIDPLELGVKQGGMIALCHIFGTTHFHYFAVSEL